MIIKVKNTTIIVPNWMLLVGAVVADNMYSNYCKKKAYEKTMDAVKDFESKKTEES